MKKQILRFLVVDDDLFVRTIMSDILSPYGDVELASSGKECIKKYTSLANTPEKFDVIFMDINMPDYNGIDALKEVRKIEKVFGIFPPNEVKIIMASALDNHMAVIESLKYGKANSYIVKPATIEEIQKELLGCGIVI